MGVRRAAQRIDLLRGARLSAVLMKYAGVSQPVGK